VTVSLSGLGGDELFAGYRQYLAVRWHERYMLIPSAVRRGMIRPLVRMLPVARTNRIGNALRLARKFVDASDHDLRTFWANRVSFLPVYDGPIFTGDMRGATRSTYSSESFEDYWTRTEAFSPVDRLCYMDIKMYMCEQLLMLQDKMSMAVSLEARVPMLDHRLVELAASIPDEVKLEGGVLKRLLKQVAERHVPRECIYREKKGFAAPVEAWLRGPLYERVQDVLSPRQIRERGLLEPDFVEWLKRRFYDDGQDFSVQLYQLLLLETWMTQYLDSKPAPVAPAHQD
jgi:asparagine synthase (glutamine-hydrolysing)